MILISRSDDLSPESLLIVRFLDAHTTCMPNQSHNLIGVLDARLRGGDFLHGFPLHGAVFAGAFLGRGERRFERRFQGLESFGGHLDLLRARGGGFQGSQSINVDALRALLRVRKSGLRGFDEVHVRLGDGGGLHLIRRGLLVARGLAELLNLVPHRSALVHTLLGNLQGVRQKVVHVAVAGEGNGGLASGLWNIL